MQTYSYVLAYVVSLQGGFRAVIWSDVFQCLVVLAGMAAVVTMVIVVSSENYPHPQRMSWSIIEKVNNSTLDLYSIYSPVIFTCRR